MGERLEMVSLVSPLAPEGVTDKEALQIAIALATHDAAEETKESGEKLVKIRVEKDHFEKVIDRRKAFIKYRDSIRNKNEDQRAYVEGNRALMTKKT
jgi:hypothetical protein